jgi:hypothetical protein
MADNESRVNHKKIIEFMPLKTMSMDLESILANLAKLYINQNDFDMVELVSMSQAELFPIGSFDSEAERYEYVLKLAVPVQFHNHLSYHIQTIQPRLLKDISTITAAYIHEFISEVFISVIIEQDSTWREKALDFVELQAAENRKGNSEISLLCANGDENGIASEIAGLLGKMGIVADIKELAPHKKKEHHHVLADLEKTSRSGVCVISKRFMELELTQEFVDALVSRVINPDQRFCQIWDKVSRNEVANFSPALARSLAYTTERMSSETISGFIAGLLGLHVAP